MFSVCLSLSLYVCVSLSLTLSVSLTVCLSLSVYFRLNFFNLQILNCDRINHYADKDVKCLTNIKLHFFVKIYFFRCLANYLAVFGLIGPKWPYQTGSCLFQSSEMIFKVKVGAFFRFLHNYHVEPQLKQQSCLCLGKTYYWWIFQWSRPRWRLLCSIRGFWWFWDIATFFLLYY